ncbi:MAG: hypothetical protein HOV67_04010 [Kribbellaceae bacterium]|nr:hypothetical protein [Kribbellaceae bacterium]
MSTERGWVVGVPADPSIRGLVDDVRSAAGRASKSEAGDRLDIARFEELATRLEQVALNYAGAFRIPVPIPTGGPAMLLGEQPETWPDDLSYEIREAARSLVARQLVPILVVDPYAPGSTDAPFIGVAEEPAEPWSADKGVFGNRAVEARFRDRLAETLEPVSGRRLPISPSGVTNAVVTEILREFVESAAGVARVDAPVEYRDGSRSAHPFPLRALPLRSDLPPASLELRFALLSIRHTEMDAVVDGAWLRNTEISRPRPAALTDDLVYDLSRRQLEELCRTERHIRLHLYQTGLETAIVGFYRALTNHLLAYPGSVSVQPMYFVAPRRRPALQPSRSGSARDGRTAVPTDSSTFRKGSVWTT